MNSIGQIYERKTIDEVIKAWDCCAGYDPRCEDCPYRGRFTNVCTDMRMQDTYYYLHQHKALCMLLPSVVSVADEAVKKGKTIG